MADDRHDQCGTTENAEMTDVGPTSSVVCVNGIESVKRTMIERVASKEEQFVHLRQRDEPDMSLDERLSLVEKLLAESPGEFLARFGFVLTVDDLVYFDKVCSSDYIVQFRTTEIRRKLSNAGSKLQQAVVKNRRYEAMRRLEALGEYFSDEEMKHRDPLLYEDMIGQHMTDDDVQAMRAAGSDRSTNDPLLSEVLMQHIQVMQNNELYERQKDAEESQMEEEDEDSDDDDQDSAVNGDKSGDVAEETVSDYEKAALRNEFIEIMKQRFLDGKDREFNYSDVDNNTDYDALDQLSRDAEDKYFNDDDSDTSDVRSQPVADYDF